MSPAVMSEDRVEVIVTRCISDYETKIGNVRHEQNLAKFEGVFAVLNKIDGSFTAIKLMCGFIAFLVMAILALLSYLGTHRTNTSMISTDHFTAAK